MAVTDFVCRVLRDISPGLVYDVGGNTGTYSRIASECGHRCVLYDADMACIERVYTEERKRGSSRILPLHLDFSNPTPPLGVNLKERAGVLDRPRADLSMALALVHHLRLRENIPFALIAEFFARLGRRLLIEWVGPDDVMAREMIESKRTPPSDYDMGSFLDGFSKRFSVLDQAPVAGMDRTMMVLECRE